MTMNNAPGVSSSSSPNADKERNAFREGPVARAIEEKTARLPSDFFLWLAGASIAGSAILKGIELFRPHAFVRRDKGAMSNFVGMWAPTFLILGLYNKLVKVAGSDQTSH